MHLLKCPSKAEAQIYIYVFQSTLGMKRGVPCLVIEQSCYCFVFSDYFVFFISFCLFFNHLSFI